MSRQYSDPIPAIEYVFELEGLTFTDDPDDPGGETSYGVTKNTARYYGYKGDMKDFSRDDAIGVYTGIWNKLRLGEVKDQELANEIFEFAVNVGNARGIKFIQRAVNLVDNVVEDRLVVDGLTGPNTLKGINAFPAKRLIIMLNAIQASEYIRIAEKNPTMEKYVKGWLEKRAFNKV